ncbi:hypothetical protein TREMEDRAFT_33548, partial [Tremella mesenterica DSM 1558]|uniref:uncharacterized protein n=1 Tax=Tremella mesenterica (strain ATCC 24925 / CBS 8224 / DSM 1558 / NBRC 9311 / NRRL Y-6157 / RJB 2259-6 / UBC 559-6) TaxID=578456 RepID=UPI0003F4A109
ISLRIRPLNKTEIRMDTDGVWHHSPLEHNVLKLARGREGTRDDKEWVFDRVLPPNSTNSSAYTTSARAHVKAAMDGFNSVCFAYGQTASGKTYTLTGSPNDPGIIPLAISDLFSQIRHSPDREFLLRASYLELYNETILDLLSPEPRELSLAEGKKKGEVVINGLTECAVRAEDEVRRLLRKGEERRKVGGTDWNTRSSRSHCVFRVVIESRSRSGNGDETPLPTRTPGKKNAGTQMTRISTLSIIDLAGSEKHTSSKERNAEGKHINQSLLTLKLVISKLADMASKRTVMHVPYRDSKLTRLLQPSLSGDALISVICTISPSSLNVAESMSTLAFAQGLKRVVLRAEKKELADPQALIQQYQNEIAELRALLREREGQETQVTKAEKQNNAALEKRLGELRSLILTSGNVRSPSIEQEGEARPLSPTKLKYPRLDYGRSTAELQEDLHAAELKVTAQEEELHRLRMALEARPVNADQRIVELQNEISQLKMIADDYERHLAEPSRKVREDVEREWSGRVEKLERQLETKAIWAIRLDENIRALTEENKGLKSRCAEAENTVALIKDWLFSALTEDPSIPNPSSSHHQTSLDETVSVSDFGPTLSVQNKDSLMARGMTRAQFSRMDLATLSEKFGSLTMGRGSRKMNGGRMLRDESCFGFTEGDDDIF